MTIEGGTTGDPAKDEQIADLITETDTTRIKEADVLIDDNDEDVCLNCGFKMIRLSACHKKCPNCGMENPCSDKGLL